MGLNNMDPDGDRFQKRSSNLQEEDRVTYRIIAVTVIVIVIVSVFSICGLGNHVREEHGRPDAGHTTAPR